MQAAGNLVGVVVELTAGMQHGHDDLGRRPAFLRVQVDRNATSVIGDGDGFIRMYGDVDLVAVPGERLIDRVVHHLENHVVQTGAVIGIADVHSRALADCLESL